MKSTLLLVVLFSQSVFALDAVVTVLETPMLSSPNLDAPVVQYLRKGDVVKLHPSLANNESFDHLAPSEEKRAKLQEELENSPEWKQDEFFTYKPLAAKDHDEFVPTLDRQGNTVFVIRDHVYIYYENKKELNQTVLTKDPTDYRLQEPLPTKYPLYSPSGYRGLVMLGVTQPYYESYPYTSDVKAKGYMSPIDFTVALLRVVPHDQQDRFYFGGNLNVRVFSNSFFLTNGRDTTEKGIRMGIGPYITYDAYKAEKNRINLYGSINFNFFNQLMIYQSDDTRQDERSYRAYSIAPRLGAQYHRKKIFEDVDFVMGTGLEIEPATTFRAKNAAKHFTWWQDPANDKFTKRTTFSLAVYLGFQSAY